MSTHRTGTSDRTGLPFLRGSEMAARVQAFDWSGTVLGPLEGWPQSLRVAIGVCLNSRFPMFVWWGPDRINIYNDAYIPVLGGRHPVALGQPAHSVWKEIWPVVGPQADVVMQRGEATWNESVHLLMERHGYKEDTWFTWSYSPIPDESGGIGGLFCACTEDTARVRAERERDRVTEQRVRAEDALRERRADWDRQHRIYEAILNNTLDLAYVFGLDHRFTYANDVLLRMWGRTWEEAIGRNCLELGYEPWHAAMHDREIDQVIATKAPIRGQVPFEGTFGRRMYEYIFVPVLNADGEVEAVAGTTRDVTEREQLLASERAARATAERAGRLKDEFLATLSHELRTPLNAVLGWAQLLRHGSADAETLGQGLEVIERNARLQSKLIADLLDMSRVISGKMRLDIQSVELQAVIGAALDAVRPAADAKEIAIRTELDHRIGPVGVDPARLQQVVWNLLSNAVKFTPRGGTVVVGLARVGPHVEVSVADSGRGIEPAFLPHVFERFRQADGSSAREHGGLGIGLAIVKELVDLHGGSVRVSSEGTGRGATFTVALPAGGVVVGSRRERRSSGAGAGSAAPLHSQPRSLAGVRVLVVEDEPDARDLVRRVLEEWGAEVSVAATADEALAAAAERPIDVIVSDIGLPGRDGYEFMRTLRGGGSRVPAAALTAFARAEDRARALGAGYQTHLTKPIEPAALVASVALLAAHAAEDERRERA